MASHWALHFLVLTCRAFYCGKSRFIIYRKSFLFIRNALKAYEPDIRRNILPLEIDTLPERINPRGKINDRKTDIQAGSI